MSRPHVYYALRKLAERGLISGRTERTGERERMVHEVTPQGREALADPGWATASLPAPFTTWLGPSTHARAQDAVQVLSARRAFLVAQLARERATLEGAQSDPGPRARVAQAMVTLALRQYETELAWLDEVGATVA